jgi:dimethylsulfone monooxygenase
MQGSIGHGGEIGFNDEQLDVVTSAAALSQLTRSILLFSTVHVTYAFHPLHFARFGAQIDYLSNGRWGLNVVTGWFAEEIRDVQRLIELALTR